jgi:hypothetical protein
VRGTTLAALLTDALGFWIFDLIVGFFTCFLAVAFGFESDSLLGFERRLNRISLPSSLIPLVIAMLHRARVAFVGSSPSGLKWLSSAFAISKYDFPSSHIFFNFGQLKATRFDVLLLVPVAIASPFGLAIHSGYQQSRDDCVNWHLAPHGVFLIYDLRKTTIHFDKGLSTLPITVSLSTSAEWAQS